MEQSSVSLCFHVLALHLPSLSLKLLFTLSKPPQLSYPYFPSSLLGSKMTEIIPVKMLQRVKISCLLGYKCPLLRFNFIEAKFQRKCI